MDWIVIARRTFVSNEVDVGRLILMIAIMLYIFDF